jgi:hypothetical protein
MRTSRPGVIAVGVVLLALALGGAGALESWGRARDSAPEVRDEVKVLEAVVEARQAALAVEKKALEEAARRNERMQKARQTPLVCIADADYFDVVHSHQTALARVTLREAELRESKVQLAQAERRLAAPEPPASRPADVKDGGEGSRARRGSAGRQRDDQRQQARDEVEWLTAILEVKKANLAVEKQVLEEAEVRLRQMDVRRSIRRGVNDDEYRAVSLNVQAARVRVPLREAVLRESQVRLAQAKRRLAALEPPTSAPAADSTVGTDERLRELERKVDALRKEVEELRKIPRMEKAK